MKSGPKSDTVIEFFLIFNILVDVISLIWAKSDMFAISQSREYVACTKGIICFIFGESESCQNVILIAILKVDEKGLEY